MIVIDHLSFPYLARQDKVLADIDLRISPREITALVGPSGCGKTTLLNLIAGLLHPIAGEIRWEGSTPARFGYVFQEPTLVPWRSIRWNALFGAVASGQVDAATAGLCDRLLTKFGLGRHASAYPATLSGGMQQRVALVRALVAQPTVLLLDEPFANSDYFMRLELQEELQTVVLERGVTTILVTHDLEDCLRFADRVVVMGGQPAKVVADHAIRIPQRDRSLPTNAERMALHRVSILTLLHSLSAATPASSAHAT